MSDASSPASASGPTTGWPHIELDPAWYAAIPKRVSRRRFDSTPLTNAELARLRPLADSLSQAGVRITVLGSGAEDVFVGTVGGYGTVTGASAAALFSARDGFDLQLGYLGQALVLQAAATGLDSCWVAGLFSRKNAGRHVPLSAGERVIAVVALGHALAQRSTAERATAGVARAHTRLSLDEIAPGVTGWPDWAHTAVEAARLAPSGGNKQPWRFSMDGDDLVLADQPAFLYWTHRIDCGIAMLHAELGALAAGVAGGWRVGTASEDDARGTAVVARFVPE